MRLAAIAALLLAGILAETQVGKIAPLIGWYQGEVGFSLLLIGWLTSMIGIFVALAALPAGWIIERAGMRMRFAVACVVMTAGGIALAFLGGAWYRWRTPSLRVVGPRLFNRARAALVLGLGRKGR